MTTETSPPSRGPSPGRPWWPFAVVVAILAVGLASAQLGWVSPIDPVRGTPQTAQPQLLWVTGDFGSATQHVVGNHTVEGNKLILNYLVSTANATATWSISFPETNDVQGQTLDYTFWVPAEMQFLRNDTPLHVTVNGEAFRYQPTLLANATNWPTQVYVPSPNSSQQLPGLFGGFLNHQLYVPFSGTFRTINSTVTVQMTVPAGAEVTLPNIVLSISPAPSGASAATAQQRGWLLLPVLAVAVAAFAWALRKLDVRRVGTVFALGIGIRVALAPLFLHTDLVTLIQFPTFFYSYGITNLQSFIYGPTWFASLIVPASPFYAAGVSPSTDAFNVLFKLTPIAFDGLTYLVLLRLITGLRDEKTAYRWATFGWLLNPFVIYFSAVHGLNESVVAFFVVLAVYLVLRSHWLRGAVGQTLAVLTLYPAAFAIPPLLAIRGRPVRFVVATLALPVVLMAILFLAVYRSVAPAWAYLGVVIGSTSASNLPTYGALGSAQTPWLLFSRGFGFVPNPLEGLILAASLFLVLVLVRRPVSPATLPAAVLLAMLFFYLSYQSFFVQLLIWIVPLLVILLALRLRPSRQALSFLLGTSLFALGINLAAPWFAFVTTVLSLLLFTALFVPLLVLVPSPLPSFVRRAVRAIDGIGFAVAIALLALTESTVPTAWDLVGLTLIVAVGAGIVAFVPIERPQWAERRGFDPLLSGVCLMGLLGYFYAVFYTGSVVVTGLLLALALFLALVNLSRAAWATHLWLGTYA